MATKIYRGDAQQIAQKQTITIGGTPATNDVYKVTINRKVVSYTETSGTPTTSTVATGLATALQGAGLAEFGEVTWPANGAVITATAAQSGKPFTCTVSVTGSGTITLGSAAPASSGQWHVDDANNWNPSAGNPGASDDVVFDVPNGKAAYGLANFTGGTLGSLKIIQGSVGLPDLNELGYQEYRPTALLVAGGCPNVVIGNGSIGPDLCRLDFQSNTTVRVDTGRSSVFTNTGQPIRLTQETGTLTLNVVSGGVGLASGVGETAQAGTVKVGTMATPGSFGASDEEARVEIGTGATVTTLNQDGGTVWDYGTITTVNMLAGILTGGGAAAVTTFNVTTNPNGTGPNAIVNWNSSGSLGTGTFDGPNITVDLSGDLRPATGTLSFKRGAKLFDPNGRLAGVTVTFDRASLAVAVIATTTIPVVL